MTEMESIDKLNPRRDLPQGTCDVISRVCEELRADKEKETRVRKLRNIISGFIVGVLIVVWVLLVITGVIHVKMGVGVPICFLLGCAVGAVCSMVWITEE